MNNNEFLNTLLNSENFLSLYSGNADQQKSRYTDLYSEYQNHFGSAAPSAFSSPGRAELSGNHTDHNHGKVLAAAVNRDAVCFASPSADNTVSLYDTRYRELIVVDLSIKVPLKQEEHSIQSLIRGISAGLSKSGYKTGGFSGCLHSEVLSGSGLSSSAAIENLVVSVFNSLYNNGRITYMETALISQYAENNFFGKPCGLMDQLASASGGMVHIDFNMPSKPEVTRISNPFAESDYSISVISPGGDHGGLTPLYSAIPAEMQKVARFLGTDYCRNISLDDLLSRGREIRKTVGDRAFLRAWHFLNENTRVDKQLLALQQGDLTGFLSLVTESGNSSWKYLQNVSVPETPDSQPLTAALALAERFCRQNGGACRVHGGGFAGTILVFFRKKNEAELVELMEQQFGKGCVSSLSIREAGCFRLI
jgi:galactokinase